MYNTGMRFTWDDDKAEKVRAEHKVEFARMIDIFDDPYAVEYEDEEHSTDTETRYAVIALTARYGLTFLSYTEPEPDEAHCITARRAEPWMVDEYEENKKRW
jgi:uncharacterized DUF497 family protein